MISNDCKYPFFIIFFVLPHIYGILYPASFCVYKKRKMLCNCLCSSSSSCFSASRIRDFGIVILVFLSLKFFQYGGSRRWVQIFPRYPSKKWYKNWYLHFYKTFDHQIWQAGTSTESNSSEANQAGCWWRHEVKITWQTKHISPLPECLWPLNLAECWLTLTGSCP